MEAYFEPPQNRATAPSYQEIIPLTQQFDNIIGNADIQSYIWKLPMKTQLLLEEFFESDALFFDTLEKLTQQGRVGPGHKIAIKRMDNETLSQRISRTRAMFRSNQSLTLDILRKTIE